MEGSSAGLLITLVPDAEGRIITAMDEVFSAVALWVNAASATSGSPHPTDDWSGFDARTLCLKGFSARAQSALAIAPVAIVAEFALGPRQSVRAFVRALCLGFE